MTILSLIIINFMCIFIFIMIHHYYSFIIIILLLLFFLINIISLFLLLLLLFPFGLLLPYIILIQIDRFRYLDIEMASGYKNLKVIRIITPIIKFPPNSFERISFQLSKNPFLFINI